MGEGAATAYSRSMTATSRPLSTRTIVIGALVAVLALVVVLGLWRPLAAPTKPVAAASDPAALSPAALTLPDSPRVLVFGDSWTWGAAASDPTSGYAYLVADLIGGETIVNGEPGSGYLRQGRFGHTYGERIAALDPASAPDAVIIQGSINDRKLGAPGYREAVTAAWDALAQTYPDATIIVLGPAPHHLPIGKGTARIDRDLRDLAAARGWWYISPIEQAWITEANYRDVIDVEVGNKHPSDAGHRYLADRLAGALNTLAAAMTVEAGESEAGGER